MVIKELPKVESYRDVAQAMVEAHLSQDAKVPRKLQELIKETQRRVPAHEFTVDVVMSRLMTIHCPFILFAGAPLICGECKGHLAISRPAACLDCWEQAWKGEDVQW